MEQAKETKAEGGVAPTTPTSSIETTPNLIDKAEAVAVRMERANVEGNLVASRMEAAAARLMLSGRTEAGSTQDKKGEETPQEYAKRIMSGKK